MLPHINNPLVAALLPHNSKVFFSWFFLKNSNS